MGGRYDWNRNREASAGVLCYASASMLLARDVNIHSPSFTRLLPLDKVS